MYTFTRAQLRELDRRAAEEYGLPTLVLMENAGHGAAAWLEPSLRRSDQVLVLCGRGNNGGDGAVLARHLDAKGYSVRVVWFAELGELSADAGAQARRLTLGGIEQHFWPGTFDGKALSQFLDEAAWVVDGLLGTGLTRTVDGPLKAVIKAINGSGKPVLALDVPSGLDADAGQPLGIAVRARSTVTFACWKVGFDQPSVRDYTGVVSVVGIGVPRRLLESVSYWSR